MKGVRELYQLRSYRSVNAQIPLPHVAPRCRFLICEALSRALQRSISLSRTGYIGHHHGVLLCSCAYESFQHSMASTTLGEAHILCHRNATTSSCTPSAHLYLHCLLQNRGEWFLISSHIFLMMPAPILPIYRYLRVRALWTTRFHAL